jgi:hypothetical protein
MGWFSPEFTPSQKEEDWRTARGLMTSLKHFAPILYARYQHTYFLEEAVLPRSNHGAFMHAGPLVESTPLWQTYSFNFCA